MAWKGSQSLKEVSLQLYWELSKGIDLPDKMEQATIQTDVVFQEGEGWSAWRVQHWGGEDTGSREAKGSLLVCVAGEGETLDRLLPVASWLRARPWGWKKSCPARGGHRLEACVSVEDELGRQENRYRLLKDVTHHKILKKYANHLYSFNVCFAAAWRLKEFQ